MTLGSIIVELGINPAGAISGAQQGERAIEGFGSSAQRVAQVIGSSMSDVERLTLRTGGAVELAGAEVRQELVAIQAASNQTAKSLERMGRSGGAASAPLRAVGTGGKNAQQAIIGLSYALNDAQQFSYGASAGFRAIANNITPIILSLGGGAGAIALFTAAGTAATFLADGLGESASQAKAAAKELDAFNEKAQQLVRRGGPKFVAEASGAQLSIAAVASQSEIIRLQERQRELSARITSLTAAEVAELRKIPGELQAWQSAFNAIVATQAESNVEAKLLNTLQRAGLPIVEEGVDLAGRELKRRRELVDAVRDQIKEIERLNRKARQGEVQRRPLQEGVLRRGIGARPETDAVTGETRFRPGDVITEGFLDRKTTALGTKELRAYGQELRSAGMSAEEAARLQEEFNRQVRDGASEVRAIAAGITAAFQGGVLQAVDNFASTFTDALFEIGSAERRFHASQLQLTRLQIQQELRELEEGQKKRKISRAQFNAEMEKLRERLDSGRISQERFWQEEEALRESLRAREISHEEYTLRVKALNDELALVEREAALATASFIEQTFEALKQSVRSAMQDVIREITRALLKAAALKALTALFFPSAAPVSFGSLFVQSLGLSQLEGRATGGPVEAGRPYVVGEEGPELIFPDRPGFVLTAPETRDLLAGDTTARRASQRLESALQAPSRPPLPSPTATQPVRRPEIRPLASPAVREAAQLVRTAAPLAPGALPVRQTAAELMPAATSFARTMGGPPAALRERESAPSPPRSVPPNVSVTLQGNLRVGMGDLYFELEEYKTEQGIGGSA